MNKVQKQAVILSGSKVNAAHNVTLLCHNNVTLGLIQFKLVSRTLQDTA